MTASAPVESEVKLRIEDRLRTRQALEAMGATLQQPRAFEDNLVFDREGLLRSRGHLLRVRRSAGGAVVTFKGPSRVEEGVRVRTEVETRVEDPQSFEWILGMLGYRPVFRYQKYRETFSWRDLVIVLDDTPLGCFLEIEGTLDSIHLAAVALGASSRDYITASYAQLFRDAGGVGDMVFAEEGSNRG